MSCKQWLLKEHILVYGSGEMDQEETPENCKEKRPLKLHMESRKTYIFIQTECTAPYCINLFFIFTPNQGEKHIEKIV